MSNESTGQLIISIDVTQADSVTPLWEIVDRYRLPATWAVADFSDTRLLQRLQAAPGQEIALLGDASWVGRSHGRTPFARALNQRITAARRQGIELHTLALQGTRLDQHLDLLVKHRLGVVRAGEGPSNGKLVRPQSLRYGIWQVASSTALPSSSAWPWTTVSGTVKRQLRKAVGQPQLVHLAVDAARLAAADIAAIETLGKFVRSQQGRTVKVRTLRELGQKLATRQMAAKSGARSILRPAA